jgi:hypothetical protein
VLRSPGTRAVAAAGGFVAALLTDATLELLILTLVSPIARRIAAPLLFVLPIAGAHLSGTPIVVIA